MVENLSCLSVKNVVCFHSIHILSTLTVFFALGMETHRSRVNEIYFWFKNYANSVIRNQKTMNDGNFYHLVCASVFSIFFFVSFSTTQPVFFSSVLCSYRVLLGSYVSSRSEYRTRQPNRTNPSSFSLQLLLCYLPACSASYDVQKYVKKNV